MQNLFFAIAFVLLVAWIVGLTGVVSVGPAIHLCLVGAIVLPSVCDGLAQSRAKGLLQLFERKGLLPRTLKFRVALEDLDGVRAFIETGGVDAAAVTEAFRSACHFEHGPIACALLDRLIALDAELGRRIEARPGRAAFIKGLTDDKSLLVNMDVGAVQGNRVKRIVTNR